MRRFLFLGITFGLLIGACSRGGYPPADPDLLPDEGSPQPTGAGAPAMRSATATLTMMPEATASPAPTFTPTRLVAGPGYSEGINPLTGLPVQDEASLAVGPVLVSITNFPLSARPQSGLSLASHVWETSIGEGMTRFIAVYYGDFLEELEQLEADLPVDYDRDYVLGPVRSGRVAFQEIKRLYPGGRLLIRYASQEVIKQLTGWILVRALDPEDINSAGLTLDDLGSLELPAVDPAGYAHLTFDSQPPPDGEAQDELLIVYNNLNHVGWTFDPATGKYLRSQDRADGSGELHPATERLTGERIGFENVVVIWTRHSFENVKGTILEIDLVYLPDGYGFLLRDGMRYDIRWSTRAGELRIHDREGNPIPLKPGRTLFEVVSQFSAWDEEQGLVRYVRPALPTLTPTPTMTPTLTPTATETP